MDPGPGAGSAGSAWPLWPLASETPRGGKPGGSSRPLRSLRGLSRVPGPGTIGLRGPDRERPAAGEGVAHTPPAGERPLRTLSLASACFNSFAEAAVTRHGSPVRVQFGVVFPAFAGMCRCHHDQEKPRLHRQSLPPRPQGHASGHLRAACPDIPHRRDDTTAYDTLCFVTGSFHRT